MAGRRIRVIQFGLGPIGAGVARLIASRPGYQIVGAIDVDPRKVGRDAGELIGLDRDLGVKVSADAARVLKKPADVVMHCTSSSLAKVEPELAAVIRAKHNLVSTCEELSMPWSTPANARAARRIDALAKKARVSVLGTGINPGYMMDTLPLVLTGVCQQVESVRIRRVVDASKRRQPLQKKIGTGLAVEEFRAKAGREIRHVGLTESIALIARTLGWKLDQIEETIEPVVASQPVKTEFYDVAPGRVTGVEQYGYGIAGGKRVVELHLRMCVDAGDSVDEVWLEGKPPIHSVVYGVHGDLSTAAVAANCIRRVVAAPPGLLTMADIPIVTVA
ncbi:MAG: dihydrodipicolinate reductase [Chloroflexi bacterium]|nr:dihydrodipicolinate reductase [Chloroflexota bacterium]